jgi:hypothetical protein
MDKSNFRKLVKEELAQMMKEAEKDSSKIATKLETLRKKFVSEMTENESIGWASNSVPEKRVAIKTVSELIDIPLHELTLYFLNNTKTKMDENQNVFYSMGQVYFRNHNSDKQS